MAIIAAWTSPTAPSGRGRRPNIPRCGALSYSLRTIWPTFWQPVVESFRKGALANVKSADQLSVGLYRADAVDRLRARARGLAAAPGRRLSLALVATIYFISRYVDYLNHYGCNERSDDPYACANNSTSRAFNAVCHNFGYHTAHHLRPAAHWTELPAIHACIAHRIPHGASKDIQLVCVLLPYHCLRAVAREDVSRIIPRDKSLDYIPSQMICFRYRSRPSEAAGNGTGRADSYGPRLGCRSGAPGGAGSRSQGTRAPPDRA